MLTENYTLILSFFLRSLKWGHLPYHQGINARLLCHQFNWGEGCLKHLTFPIERNGILPPPDLWWWRDLSQVKIWPTAQSPPSQTLPPSKTNPTYFKTLGVSFNPSHQGSWGGRGASVVNIASPIQIFKQHLVFLPGTRSPGHFMYLRKAAMGEKEKKEHPAFYRQQIWIINSLAMGFGWLVSSVGFKYMVNRCLSKSGVRQSWRPPSSNVVLEAG